MSLDHHSGLADIALDLRAAIADAELAEVSFALELEALVAGARRSKLELVAARIGLSRDATDRVLNDYARRATLLRAGHKAIMRMIEADS